MGQAHPLSLQGSALRRVLHLPDPSGGSIPPLGMAVPHLGVVGS